MGEEINVMEFILLGLTQDAACQKAFFVMFLLIYIVTIVGKLLNVGTEIANPIWHPQGTSSLPFCYSRMLFTPLPSSQVKDFIYEKNKPFPSQLVLFSFLWSTY